MDKSLKDITTENLIKTLPDDVIDQLIKYGLKRESGNKIEIAILNLNNIFDSDISGVKMIETLHFFKDYISYFKLDDFDDIEDILILIDFQLHRLIENVDRFDDYSDDFKYLNYVIDTLIDIYENDKSSDQMVLFCCCMYIYSILSMKYSIYYSNDKLNKLYDFIEEYPQYKEYFEFIEIDKYSYIIIQKNYMYQDGFYSIQYHITKQINGYEFDCYPDDTLTINLFEIHQIM